MSLPVVVAQNNGMKDLFLATIKLHEIAYVEKNTLILT